MLSEPIMNNGTLKRGILLNSGISRESLIIEFTSGMTLAEIARGHGRSSARIWQIIRSGCDENTFQHYKQEQKNNRQGLKLKSFMELVEKLGRTPCLFEVKATLPGAHMHYAEFKKL